MYYCHDPIILIENYNVSRVKFYKNYSNAEVGWDTSSLHPIFFFEKVQIMNIKIIKQK